MSNRHEVISDDILPCHLNVRRHNLNGVTSQCNMKIRLQTRSLHKLWSWCVTYWIMFHRIKVRSSECIISLYVHIWVYSVHSIKVCVQSVRCDCFVYIKLHHKVTNSLDQHYHHDQSWYKILLLWIFYLAVIYLSHLTFWILLLYMLTRSLNNGGVKHIIAIRQELF